MGEREVATLTGLRPTLIRREGDRGWLAVSPPESAFRIGVASPTEEGARAEFEAAVRRWVDILSQAH